jgi:DNA repair exonuclease
MIRTRVDKKPNAIFCSDLHLREDTPVCRTDDFVQAQFDKLDYISALQRRYDCPVLCAGDLFDKWKPSPWLLSMAMIHLPDCFYTILGQHDLPQHSLELIHKCGAFTLQKANRIHILPFCHWGQIPEGWKNFEGSVNMGGPKILVWHKMNYQGKKPWPGCTDPPALGLLRKYPQYDIIVTGDNHKTFVEEYQGRYLINPGSMMRMDADQVDHKPCVFLWYAEDNTIKQVFLPIQQNVISREHLEVKKERDARIDAFVSQLDGEWEGTISFEENLERFFQKNRTRHDTKTIIYKSLE